jgi:predicted dehydrogenase
VVGLGTISDIFMRACHASTKAKVVALVTGHPIEKGRRYAAIYGIPESAIYTYETYDRLRENNAVEAVYIGLPNNMHREYAERAAAAGKHVLCEKPMAISNAECRSMIAACSAAGVKLMIAYRIQYEPLWNQLRKMVQNADIGQVQSFQGGFFNQQQAGAWRLSRRLGGGGSVLDLGIYPLNSIRWIAGEEPAEFAATVSTRDHSGRFAEVEQSIEWTMKLPSGIIASCASSYGQTGPGFLNVNGDKGYLQMQPGFFYDGPRLTGITGRKTVDISSPGRNPYQFTLEAEHFADCVRLDQTPHTPGEEGLKDLLAIESIYKSAGTPIA